MNEDRWIDSRDPDARRKLADAAARGAVIAAEAASGWWVVYPHHLDDDERDLLSRM